MSILKVLDCFGGKSIGSVSKKDIPFQSFMTCQKSFFTSLNKKHYLNFMAELRNTKHVRNS